MCVIGLCLFTAITDKDEGDMSMYTNNEGNLVNFEEVKDECLMEVSGGSSKILVAVNSILDAIGNWFNISKND